MVTTNSENTGMTNLVAFDKRQNTYKLAANVQETLDFVSERIAYGDLMGEMRKVVSSCEGTEETRREVLKLLRDVLVGISRTS